MCIFLACMQKFTNESGNFSPSAFYDVQGVECIYVIERPAGDIIELELTTSRLSYYYYSRASCLQSNIEVSICDYLKAGCY